MLRHADIASLHEPPAPLADPVAREWSIDERWRITRTQVLKGAVATAVGLSVAALELGPLARIAKADGYDIYTDQNSGPCDDYAIDHNCSPGCGDSPVCGGGSDGYCCTGSGWFRTDGTTYSGYALRPNECWSGTYDGWRWQCPGGALYRCHDGWVYTCGGSCLYRYVCRHNV